jgi:prevent-host-death family protein
MEEVSQVETAYRREEIVSSSKASKQLGEVLDKAKRKGRMVLSRNNRLEAVILPIEEYEILVEDLEHLLTALEIQERKARDRGKRVSWDSLKAKYGL